MVLKDAFGLSLFGFDVIVSTQGTPTPARLTGSCHEQTSTKVGEDGARNDIKPFLVVDVNFFPSYKEVSDFPRILRAFLRRAASLPPWQ